jgi:hypothetical protein
MSISNAAVAAVLRSPLHRTLSSSIDLVRFVGCRSGRTIVTPTQYAVWGEDLIILVGRANTKTWWRNFRTQRDVDVLVAGRWRAMTGEVVIGADQPEQAGPLLDTYFEQLPKAARSLGDGDRRAQLHRAVLVLCRPRDDAREVGRPPSAPGIPVATR